MIEKVLVANRGEIARRIFRTCRELGISTVAVYSEPDKDAPFVREADEAVPLGGTSATQSYLRSDAIIRAAQAAGADAVHPGYGFLSESADFARLCAQAGLIFIGPSPEAIAMMGSKLEARELMQAANVPVLPGIDISGRTDQQCLEAAHGIGFPILVKAAYGGGGRGMRIVRHESELVQAIASARREAASSFGNDTVFLELYVDEPRHVEIQIFGDTHGNVVHLFERECSIQRRHQKILEESPSTAVDEGLRARMGAAAVGAARAIGYVGAGTVEFLLAPTGDFYFLEINTRLQVEHPVTELVTGLDLVALQIQVAEGRELPENARHAQLSGHAIEARVYAEDPLADFKPATGRLIRFTIPESPGVRVDSGVDSGDVVSVHYDPMLAKVIAYGSTRAEAVRRLSRALRSAQIFGVVTNVSLLIAILAEPEFRNGAIDTHYLERHPPASFIDQGARDSDETLHALAAALASQAAQRGSAKVLRSLPTGWRNNPDVAQSRTFATADGLVTVKYRLGRDNAVEVNGEKLEVTLLSATHDLVDLVAGGVRLRFTIVASPEATYVQSTRGSFTFLALPRFPEPQVVTQAGSLIAPMPGTVVRVAVVVGDHVIAGETLAVIEAMKMEYQVVAAAAGTVVSLAAKVGETVETGDILAVLEEDELADV